MFVNLVQPHLARMDGFNIGSRHKTDVKILCIAQSNYHVRPHSYLYNWWRLTDVD